MSSADYISILVILLIILGAAFGTIALFIWSFCYSASCADRHGWRTWEDLDSYARDCEARWEAEGNSAKLHKDSSDETTQD